MIGLPVTLNSLLFLTLLSLSTSPAIAGVISQPLASEQVFNLKLEATHTDSIIAHWQITPGYYLYRERIKFAVVKPVEAVLGNIHLPAGLAKTDKILGNYQVYENRATVAIPILHSADQATTLRISYQGCAKSGFCYPPIHKLASIAPNGRILALADEATVANIQNEQTHIESLLTQNNAWLSLAIFLGLGLLLAFTPCVLPMIPILSSIIAGQGNITSAKAFRLTLTYVLAVALTYAVMGSLIAHLGSNIQASMQSPPFIITIAILFVVLASGLFGLFELQIPRSWQQRLHNFNQQQQGGKYIGVAMMGVFSNIIVSPCITPPLVGTLAYIGKTGDALFGATALFALGLGMGLPLLVIGTSLGKVLPKAGAWTQMIKSVFGVLMLGVAIWMLSRILPASMILFLWGCLAIGTAIYLAFGNRIAQVLGFILFIVGAMQIYGSMIGNTNPFNPISHTQANVNALNFIPIKSTVDLNHQLAIAKTQHRKVMLDFYADWCVACKEMDRTVFSDSAVKSSLHNFMLLRADVTANDTEDKALLKNLGVVAPPTLLFFDSDGNEISQARIVGEMGVKKFITHLLRY